MAAPSQGSRSRARRAALAFGDQALSSLSNFGLAVMVARSTTAAEFGAYAVMFGLYAVVLSLSRAVATEPLAVRFSAVTHEAWRSGTAAATGTAFAVGLVAAAVSAVIGALSGPAGGPFLVLAVAFPALLVQDAWRFAFFAVGRGGAALANDLVWAVVLGIGIVIALLEGVRGAVPFVAIWGVGATLGAVIGVAQSGVPPSLRRVREWARSQSDLAPRYVVEAAVLSGAQYANILGIGAVAGLAVVGIVRSGQVLMNGVHVATYGIMLFAVPEAVRIRGRSERAFLEFCVAIAAGLTLTSVAWGITLLLIPDAIGRLVLADAWPATREVVFPLSLSMAAGGIQAGAFVGLRALAVPKGSLPARVTSSTLFLIGGVLGAALAGPAGAAWGLATGGAIGAVSWWYRFRRWHAHVRLAPAT